MVIFVNVFAWGWVQVILPFYMQQLNHDAKTTLLWIGWGMGIAPLLIMISTPPWIWMTRRWDPRHCFVLTNLLQGCCLAALVAADTNFQVLVARGLLGLSGPSNSFAFMIAGTSSKDPYPAVAAMHTSMTFGMLMAPLMAGVATTRLGYASSFYLAAASLWAAAAVIGLGVGAPRFQSTEGSRPIRIATREILLLCALVLMGYSEVFFLGPILPVILERAGTEPLRALAEAGWLLFASGCALAVGSLAAPALRKRFGDHLTATGCLAASSAVLVLMPFTVATWSMATAWVLHVALIAPLFPVATARASSAPGRQAVGLLNVARVGANFVGPVAATTILSQFTSQAVFWTFATSGLVAASLVLAVRGRDLHRVRLHGANQPLS
jgi:MFS family permease